MYRVTEQPEHSDELSLHKATVADVWDSVREDMSCFRLTDSLYTNNTQYSKQHMVYQ